MADPNAFWDELYAEVRAFRAALPDDAGPKERGFAILSNPPAPGELLVMGLHPRRHDAADAAAHAAMEQGPPAAHLNVSERGGDLLAALRDLLAAAELDEAEAAAVWHAMTGANRTNLWLFGASGPEEWESDAFWGHGGADLRARVEAACLQWHERMMSALQPAGLLFEGLASYSHLGDHRGDCLRQDGVLARTEGKGRLAVEGRFTLKGRELPVLAMRHPSSCWVLGAADRRLLGQVIARFCRRTGRV